MRVRIYTDGGSRGNPGPAASAAVIQSEDGQPLATITKYLGTTTNNQAEYTAIILGLQKAQKLGAREVEVLLDSELAERQLNGQYKVKNPEIAKRFLEVKNLCQSFSQVKFRHVRRENNQEADALVNKCLDEEGC